MSTFFFKGIYLWSPYSEDFPCEMLNPLIKKSKYLTLLPFWLKIPLSFLTSFHYYLGFKGFDLQISSFKKHPILVEFAPDFNPSWSADPNKLPKVVFIRQLKSIYRHGCIAFPRAFPIFPFQVARMRTITQTHERTLLETQLQREGWGRSA